MIGPEHKVTFTEVGKPKENRVGKEVGNQELYFGQVFE